MGTSLGAMPRGRRSTLLIFARFQARDTREEIGVGLGTAHVEGLELLEREAAGAHAFVYRAVEVTAAAEAHLHRVQAPLPARDARLR